MKELMNTINKKCWKQTPRPLNGKTIQLIGSDRKVDDNQVCLSLSSAYGCPYICCFVSVLI